MSNKQESAGQSGGKARRGAGQAPRAVRIGVLKHMRKLLAGGATAGAASNLCGCMDPPPPPPYTVECDEPSLDPHVEANAWWDQELERFAVTVTIYLRPTNLTISGPPTLVGAELRDVEFGTDWLDMEFVPTADSTEVRATVPIQCDAEARNVTVVFDISSPADGYPVPTQVE